LATRFIVVDSNYVSLHYDANLSFLSIILIRRSIVLKNTRNLNRQNGIIYYK